jgi:transcriptional regulator with XRE-family HTH domain
MDEKGKKEKQDFKTAFGLHLKKVREGKGMSQREMELEGDLDRHIISKFENGKTGPTLYSVKKICTVLNVSMEEFFAGFKH